MTNSQPDGRLRAAMGWESITDTPNPTPAPARLQTVGRKSPEVKMQFLVGTYDRAVVLRCTKKLIGVIGASFVSVPGPPPDEEDWYANILWFDRRKCLLLTQAATLFTIFEADVTASKIRSGSSFFGPLIARELLAEGLPSDVFGDIASEEIVWAKTASRSILGCMNDMAFLCEMIVAESGSLRATDQAELNRFLHRNINRTRFYTNPIELARERMKNP